MPQHALDSLNPHKEQVAHDDGHLSCIIPLSESKQPRASLVTRLCAFSFAKNRLFKFEFVWFYRLFYRTALRFKLDADAGRNAGR